MLEGVDRLVDLVGTRSAGLTGASDAQVAEWTARCDGEALGTDRRPFCSRRA